MTENIISCPIPLQDEVITLSHGSGGRNMQNLIQDLFYKYLSNEFLLQKHDSAVMKNDLKDIAMTTDSYVVNPIFFPGGDIGKLAVCGTVNDLLMVGARPLYLSLGLILEEGFSISKLEQIIISISKAAKEADVKIVTGDTKVVEKGKGDQIYINTCGVGDVFLEQRIHPDEIHKGDVIIVSGDLGRHAIAILKEREGLGFEAEVESDCALLNQMVLDLLVSGIDVHCMRDLTRGGLSAALIELSEISEKEFEINAVDIPIDPAVKGVCEILGFDPKQLACEGRFVLFIPKEQSQIALDILKKYREGINANIIGEVTTNQNVKVILKTEIGSTRVLDMPSGELLPRIC